MVNWKSPYGDYSPEEKKAQCMEDCGFKEKDLTLLEKALVKYDQIQNKNIKVRMILDIKNSLHKFMEYFGSFNMTEKIEKGQKAGQFVHSPKEFMDVIKNVKNLFDNIEEFEETLRKEMKAGPESRGQNVLGYNERA
jgi:hypothetical protein